MKKAIRPSKLDELTRATQQAYAHTASLRVIAKRELLLFEGRQLDEEIVNLTAALTQAKEQRAKVNAMIVGLNLTLAQR